MNLPLHEANLVDATKKVEEHWLEIYTSFIHKST